MITAVAITIKEVAIEQTLAGIRAMPHLIPLLEKMSDPATMEALARYKKEQHE